MRSSPILRSAPMGTDPFSVARRIWTKTILSATFGVADILLVAATVIIAYQGRASVTTSRKLYAKLALRQLPIAA